MRAVVLGIGNTILTDEAAGVRAVELLEQRVHQTNMKQFLKENPDLLPEGINVDSKYSISVRRSTAK